MESVEHGPRYNIQKSLEGVGITNVEKIELSEEYFEWAKENLEPEVYAAMVENHATIDVHRYTYLSEGLNIAGYLWTPKVMTRKLPLAIWNRGGTREFGSTGELAGTAFLNIPCDLVKQDMVVIGSEYRGGVGSEGKDEWGGGDLDDVSEVKEIADQLPFIQSEKAIVVGHSRGGMMSYLLASKKSWVKAVVSLSGTTDLMMCVHERPEMQEIFDTCFGGSEEEMKKRSATTFYNDIPKDLPLLIMHSADDMRVSVEQVQKLHHLLKTSGHTVEYHEFPSGGHGFHTVGSPQRDEALEIIKRFVKDQV